MEVKLSPLITDYDESQTKKQKVETKISFMASGTLKTVSIPNS